MAIYLKKDGAVSLSDVYLNGKKITVGYLRKANNDTVCVYSGNQFVVGNCRISSERRGYRIKPQTAGFFSCYFTANSAQDALFLKLDPVIDAYDALGICELDALPSAVYTSAGQVALENPTAAGHYIQTQYFDPSGYGEIVINDGQQRFRDDCSYGDNWYYRYENTESILLVCDGQNNRFFYRNASDATGINGEALTDFTIQGLQSGFRHFVVYGVLRQGYDGQGSLHVSLGNGTLQAVYL